LNHQLASPFRRQRLTTVEDVFQGAALDQLHRKVERASVALVEWGFTDEVEVDDVRGVQPGLRPRLAQEALLELVARGQIVGQHLHRHAPVARQVAREIPRPHATTTERFLDEEVVEAITSLEREERLVERWRSRLRWGGVDVGSAHEVSRRCRDNGRTLTA